jgi:thymidylate synthase
LQHVTIGEQVTSAALGRAWVNLVDNILQGGTPMGDEGLELLGSTVAFRITSLDEILDRFADQAMIAEMKKVFFRESPNSLGHSYAKLIRGPGGRSDFQDVIALLREQPSTKRAMVTLAGEPGGKVPCVNAVQFLIREGAVQVMYFARGQDAFRKFYADGLCLAAMAQTVAAGLDRPTGVVRGFIGSSHIYHKDTPAIRELIAGVRLYLAGHENPRALA